MNTQEVQNMMPLSKEEHRCYQAILEAELLMATGCTEPIAIAYASALRAQFWVVSRRKFACCAAETSSKMSKA